MDNITLSTINKSIEQLSNRLETSFSHVNNRIDETNLTIKEFKNDNNKSHIVLNTKIDQTWNLIAKIDKNNSLNKQNIDNHLETHKKENEKLNINGIKLANLIGNFSSALIGALTALYIYQK